MLSVRDIKKDDEKLEVKKPEKPGFFRRLTSRLFKSKPSTKYEVDGDSDDEMKVHRYL